MGAQQQVVVHQLAESLLLAEQLQQHLFDAAHALLEGAVGGHQLDHRLDVFVPGRQHFGITLAQRNLPVAGLGPIGDADQRLLIVAELLQHVAHAHVQQPQLTGQVLAVADLEGILNVPGQALEVAQVGLDLQAQAKAVLATQVGEEVVDLRIELEAVGALGHRHQDVQADPLVEQGGDVGRRALRQLHAELAAQFDQAQGAGIEALAERFEQRPVFGEGAQHALGIDHRQARARCEKWPRIVLHAQGFACVTDGRAAVRSVRPFRPRAFRPQFASQRRRSPSSSVPGVFMRNRYRQLERPGPDAGGRSAAVAGGGRPR